MVMLIQTKLVVLDPETNTITLVITLVITLATKAILARATIPATKIILAMKTTRVQETTLEITPEIILGKKTTQEIIPEIILEKKTILEITREIIQAIPLVITPETTLETIPDPAAGSWK